MSENFVGAITSMGGACEPKNGGNPYVRMKIQHVVTNEVYECFADADKVAGLALNTRVVVSPNGVTRSNKPRVRFECVDGVAPQPAAAVAAPAPQAYAAPYLEPVPNPTPVEAVKVPPLPPKLRNKLRAYHSIWWALYGMNAENAPPAWDHRDLIRVTTAQSIQFHDTQNPAAPEAPAAAS